MFSSLPLIDVEDFYKFNIDTYFTGRDQRTVSLHIRGRPVVSSSRDMPHSLKFFYPAIVNGKKNFLTSNYNEFRRPPRDYAFQNMIRLAWKMILIFGNFCKKPSEFLVFLFCKIRHS